MGTRALICGRTAEGPRAIHVGFDGDPEAAGLLLEEHYATPEAVEELLELGNLRRLGAVPTLCEQASSPQALLVNMVDDNAYVGESLVSAINGGGAPGAASFDIDWAYAFEDGFWECMPGPYGATRWEGMSIDQGVEMVRQERDDAEAENMMAMESNEDDLPSPAPC